MEHNTLNILVNSVEGDTGGVALTTSETSRLLKICIELIDLCAKVTGKIDPAVGSVVENARDEAIADVTDFGVQQRWPNTNGRHYD